VTNAEVYDRWYETPRGRWIGQRETTLLLEALQPRPGESLLDVGCGTGFFTRVLAPAVSGPVTGVDINPEWVAYAGSRDPGRTAYEVADARALPYGDDSFDLVVSIAALSFIEEQRAALREMIRVARRRIAVGLLNRRSLLWLLKGRNGGRGGYRGARWHTAGEMKELFRELPVQHLRVRTCIHIPSGGRLARIIEHLWPPLPHTGAFLLAVADIIDAAHEPPTNGRPRASSRAAAEPER
jgi:SAM-dependent methyltransferase